jgi:hypothetical protein
MEVYDLIRLIEAGQHDALRGALEAGLDANVSCPYTAMTALLWACERNDPAAVRILLDAGADPHLTHRDGYNCYDSTRSGEIKQMLLSAGFDLPLGQPRHSDFSVELRRFSAQHAVNQVHEFVMAKEGTSYKLEYKLYQIPRSEGTVRIRVGPGIKSLDVPSGSGTEGRYDIALSRPEKLTLSIGLVDFKGELRVRLYDVDVLSSDFAPLLTYPWP